MRSDTELFFIGAGFGWAACWISTWLWNAWREIKRAEATASASLPGHIVTRLDAKRLELKRRKP